MGWRGRWRGAERPRGLAAITLDSGVPFAASVNWCQARRLTYKAAAASFGSVGPSLMDTMIYVQREGNSTGQLSE